MCIRDRICPSFRTRVAENHLHSNAPAGKLQKTAIYLGGMETQDGSMNAEVDHRLRQGEKNFYQYLQFFRSTGIPFSQKRLVYLGSVQQTVLPIVTNSSATLWFTHQRAMGIHSDSTNFWPLAFPKMTIVIFENAKIPKFQNSALKLYNTYGFKAEFGILEF